MSVLIMPDFMQDESIFVLNKSSKVEDYFVILVEYYMIFEQPPLLISK